MSRRGKYVRAPPAMESEWEDSSDDEVESGQFVRAPYNQWQEEDGDYSDYDTPAPDRHKELEDQVRHLQNSIREMNDYLSDLRRTAHRGRLVETEGSTYMPTTMPPAGRPATPSVTHPSIAGINRWNDIKPFPKNLPATKMWEAWIRFFEDFEMAISLSCVTDPKQRLELLFLSMGDELKSIVRASNLRPHTDDENCYSTLVDNIYWHLKGWTDPAAEHEDFSKMVQEEGESAVKFHARLTDKVQLCDYSPREQERFVRSQLLRGLRNADVIKAAWMYTHDSNTMVQAATRAEAFEAVKPIPVSESHALAVTTNRSQGTGSRYKRGAGFSSRNPAKKFKSDRAPAFKPRPNVSRRTRCSRCFRQLHEDGEECPALRKNCNACGKRGHFAVTCRADRVNTVRAEQSSGLPEDEGRGEQVNE